MSELLYLVVRRGTHPEWGPEEVADAIRVLAYTHGPGLHRWQWDDLSRGTRMSAAEAVEWLLRDEVTRLPGGMGTWNWTFQVEVAP